MPATYAVRKLHRPLARRRVVPSLLAGVLCLGLAALACPARAEEAKDTRPKIPPPEDVELDTRDGVALKATFFPGTLGKESVPVILLHEYDGSRADFEPLARYLQGMGCSVIAPDLRGHGESTQVKGSDKALKASTLAPADFRKMLEDVETVKRFLMEKNNRGELNIEKLCVIGAEMGAVLAMEWTLVDWSWPQLPTMKQGRDVKGLVLVSPEFTFKGLSCSTAFKHPKVARDISALILVGGGKSKAVAEAKRLHGMFERFHPKPEKPADADLFYGELKTTLQGTDLIKEPSFQVEKYIAKFIQARLSNQSYPWTDRRNPLEKGRE